MKDLKRLAFVLNPVSGSGRSMEVMKHLPVLEKANKIIQVFDWKNPDEILDLNQRILEWKPDAVIAVGGDGTVNLLAGFFIHQEIPVGIVPSGSGNGLARHLGIPMDMEKAVKKLVSPRLMKIDVGKINEHYFFCTAGLGYDAFVAHRFASLKKRGLYGYAKESLLSLNHFKPKKFSVHFNGKNHDFNALILTFANASQYGNNAFIAPLANISDGLLELTVIEKINWIKIPSLAMKLFNKKIHLDSSVQSFSAALFQISCEEPGMIHFDGETAPCNKDVSISILPSSLTVLV